MRSAAALTVATRLSVGLLVVGSSAIMAACAGIDHTTAPKPSFARSGSNHRLPDGPAPTIEQAIADRRAQLKFLTGAALQDALEVIDGLETARRVAASADLEVSTAAGTPTPVNSADEAAPSLTGNLYLTAAPGVYNSASASATTSTSASSLNTTEIYAELQFYVNTSLWDIKSKRATYTNYVSTTSANYSCIYQSTPVSGHSVHTASYVIWADQRVDKNASGSCEPNNAG